MSKTLALKQAVQDWLSGVASSSQQQGRQLSFSISAEFQQKQAFLASWRRQLLSLGQKNKTEDVMYVIYLISLSYIEGTELFGSDPQTDRKEHSPINRKPHQVYDRENRDVHTFSSPETDGVS